MKRFSIVHSVDAIGNEFKYFEVNAKNAENARVKWARKYPERYFMKIREV